MSVFGRRAGRFLRDVDIFYPAVLELRLVLEELLSDDDGTELLSLPANAFVFAMRYGEQFMFFDASRPNAEIMYYAAWESSFRRIARSFSEVIESELQIAVEAYNQIKTAM